ncbi:iron complex outermembrane recepter protein [Sphingobium sp. AP50]|uniref:TonB-dependent siderophore receptor n=1 Tax=Sphingobium sp. AP50 TaxID=1884369 RepID=UPI0008BF6F20|nr:TonB-dependent siderophore receptor [Sphingobium sp. AP50]SEJ99704.1 iron complex outermembrane recepter protein [Sphingobium sp. AP50]
MINWHISASSIAMVWLMPLAAQAQQPASEEETPPSQIVVTGMHLGEANAAKTDVPLIKTPQAISVVTADTLKERGVTRLADALRSVAGVSRSSTYGFFDAYTIRGYDAAYGSVYLDGILSEAGVGSNNELAGLQQVEVVKGPASALFGSAPLGGIVNLVSKRPQADAFMDMTLSTGSYDLIEGAIDANAPLNEDISARLNLIYRDVDSFVRNSGQNRIYAAPSIKWQIAPSTSLTLLGVYQRDRDNPFSPVSGWGTVLPSAYGPTPIDFSINNGGDQKAVYNQNRKSISAMFDHRFSDAFGISQTLRYTHRTTYWDRWMFVGGFLDDNVVDGVQQGRTLGRYYYGPYSSTDKDFAVDTRATGKFATGSIRHAILAGVDYRQNRERYQGDGDFDASHFPLDVVSPDYDAPLVPTAAPYSGSAKNDQLGFYLQDHVTLTDRFTVTLSGRWDRAKSNGELQTAFSPRVGATYELVPDLALYGTWAKSFTPQFGSQIVLEKDASGAPSLIGQAPPERGRNIEGGIKFAPTDGTVSGMISLYDLERSNVLTSDPDFPNFSRVTGKQRSRGIEVEGQWRPVPGATVNVAYAYIRAKILEDETIPAGTELQNIPRHNVSLYGRYVIPTGPLANVGANLGFVYNSSRNGAVPDAALYRLPSYILVDAGLSYTIGNWGLQLTVNNLLKERYFPDSCCLDRITPGQPRNWRLSLSRHF